MNKKILLLVLILLIIIFITGCFSIMPTVGLAPVEEIEIVILESFPVQIQVMAKGNLPDPLQKFPKSFRKKKAIPFLLLLKLIVLQDFAYK